MTDTWDRLNPAYARAAHLHAADYAPIGVRIICTSGTRPGSPSTGQEIFETDTLKGFMWDGTTWRQVYNLGAPDTWTPQVDQGATTNIAKTIESARYDVCGRWVKGFASLAITGTGTAGSPITCTLPLPLVYSYEPGVAGAYYRTAATAARYTVIGEVNNLDPARTVFLNDASGNSAIGAAPNFAVASGDVLRFHFEYITS